MSTPCMVFVAKSDDFPDENIQIEDLVHAFGIRHDGYPSGHGKWLHDQLLDLQKDHQGFSLVRILQARLLEKLDREMAFLTEGLSKSRFKHMEKLGFLDSSREIENFPISILTADPYILDLGYYQYYIRPNATLLCRPGEGKWEDFQLMLSNEESQA